MSGTKTPSTGPSDKHRDWVNLRLGAGTAIDPAKLEKAAKRVAALLPGAGKGKDKIDKLAAEKAAKYSGIVRTAPLKSVERAAEKTVIEYGGDASRLKDLARNTIIVAPGKAKALIADIVASEKVPEDRIKVTVAETDPLGFSCTIINIVQPDGRLAEIQVNSPVMIYAKDREERSQQTLGDALFTKIKQAVKLPGGRGHELYERWRRLPPGSDEADKIAAESKAYYDAIRKAGASIDWDAAMQ